MSTMEAKKIETLRREFQNATARPQGACPDAERIWDAAAGELPVEQRREVVSHLCSCAECTHAWRLAWAMQAEMREEAEESASHNGRETVVTGPWTQWKPYLPKVAAAAMLILALGVGVMWNQPAPEPSEPVHRSATVEHAIESLIPEGEALPRDAFVLRWTSAGEGALYDIEVMTTELIPVDHAEDLETTEYEVPTELLTGVPANSKVLWRVVARLPDGTILSPDRTFTTQLQ